jgi:hypothetical protein
VFTFIGAGVITAGAAFSDPQPQTIPDTVEAPCYREGYRSRAKNKNVLSALLGGSIGATLFVVIYLAAAASSE